jgi:hypothetical protein
LTDIGKPGVPLEFRDLETVRRIQGRVKSKTLRFAYVPAFIVFDALHGPCYDAAGGYPVLNEGPNQFYEPGENPYTTLAAPGA